MVATWMRSVLAAMATLLALSWLGGCGARPAAPTWPIVTFAVDRARLLDLPLYVAAAIGADATQHLRFRFAPAASPPPQAWRPAPPDGSGHIFAYLAVHGDWVLLAPDRDTGFRWRYLAHLPLTVSDLGSLGQAALKAVLSSHHVQPAAIDALPFAEAKPLFLNGHLPFWLLPAGDAARLPAHGWAVVTFLTASLGPLPTRVLAGPADAPERAPVAAALNQALIYIATHPARRVAALVAARFGTTAAALAPWIAAGQALGLWPQTAFPGRGLYERLSTTMTAPGGAWPPYAQAVDPRPAEQALLRWP